MTSEGEAKIFLAEKRGKTETGWHRSLHTFNSGNFKEPTHEPFFDLTGVNDETLRAGRIVERAIGNDCLVFILPIVGGIALKLDDDTEEFFDVGESAVIHAKENSTLHFRNPYEMELVSFVTLQIDSTIAKPSLLKKPFDLEGNKNSLITLLSENKTTIRLGNFSGRIDSELPISSEAKGLFAFVIEGAFEFDNRLIQQRDGLAVWNKTKVEFESLSTEAIILLVEV